MPQYHLYIHDYTVKYCSKEYDIPKSAEYICVLDLTDHDAIEGVALVANHVLRAYNNVIMSKVNEVQQLEAHVDEIQRKAMN